MPLMKKKILLLIFLFLILITPAIANAYDGECSGNVSGGAGAVGLNLNESFKFGEYTGVTEDAFAIGDVNVSCNGQDNFYADIEGKNLGWESRSLTLETGKYGDYTFSFTYDELPHYISDNSKTILDGSGGSNLTLPSGFSKGSSTSAMLSSINSSNKDVDLKIDRQSGAFSFSKPYKKFNLDVSYKREEKNGTKSIGGIVGFHAGSYGTMILPEPVDYSTDDLNLSIAYAGEKYQAHLNYDFSNFKNNNESLSWENPFLSSSSATFPTVGKLGLDPDNQSHHFSFSGGTDLPYSTRATIIGEYGMMRQNQSLLPYSVNSGTTITTAMPRTKADASVDTTHIALLLNSRPNSKSSLSAKYKFYKTQNNTPKDLFIYVIDDAGSSQGDSSDSRALYSLPYDYTQNQVNLDGSYNIIGKTHLKLGYVFENMDREYREIATTNEHTFKASMRTKPTSLYDARLNLSYGMKKSDGEYDDAEVYNALHTSAYVSTVSSSDRYLNFSDMRMLDLANRNRLKAGSMINLYPGETTTVGLYANYSRDDYPNSNLGMQESDNRSLSVDVTFTPDEFTSIFGYYTNEQLKGKQIGRNDASDSSRNWNAKHVDKVNTLGLGVNLLLLEEIFTVKGDMSYSHATSLSTFTAGSSLSTPINMPKIKSELVALNLSGVYNLSDQWDIGARYLFESYSSDNWATDDVSASSDAISNVLTLSGSIPDYNAHVGMLFFTYNFGE